MNSIKLNLSFFAVALTCLILSLVEIANSVKVKSVEDCEVCVKFVERFDASLKDDVRKDIEKIKTAIIDDCKTRKGKDERFCYYVGGVETSATGLLLELARPLSFHMPAEKICEKLSLKDSAICELKYEKKTDFVNANFKKMKVKELKKILDDWGETCKGCTEKTDFIARVQELLPKYEPEAASRREEL